MDYRETIEYLYSQLPMFTVSGPGAYKPGLATANKLDEAFGHPHRAYRTVHVAGTNGKGSTSHMLASVLMASGLKVGLYTSPHIFDFRERIRVDGEKISEQAVVDFVRRYLEKDPECEPSFFELTTIMAFDYFRECGVDVAVIETGLGGRLDTTNIIAPELSVITNVSLDHTSLLGDTEEMIAAEKAGIMKPGVPVVVGRAEGAVRDVFAQTAAGVGAPIFFAEDDHVIGVPRVVDDEDSVEVLFDDIDAGSALVDLRGRFQVENVNTVLHALSQLGIDNAHHVREGLANVGARTGLIGRWMDVDGFGCRVIIDTGHNTGAWSYILPKLERLSRESMLHVVLGFVEDKDIEPIVAALPMDAVYYYVTPETKRGRQAQTLQQMCAASGHRGDVYDTPGAGFDAAVAAASASTRGLVFVGGSNYLIASIPGLEIALRDK